MSGGSFLAALIENVVSKYGEEAFKYLYVNKTGKIDPSLQFLINGVNARNIRGLETELKAEDVVAIIPPVGGG